ncbi:hypothetical protein OC844_006509 [Tilletia horrida]|nr:hypothetical protein OC844_006509 [Tilletia horrida]
MLAASHIGDSPARPASVYDSSSFPAGPSSSHAHSAAGGVGAVIPPRISSNMHTASGTSAGAGLTPHSYISSSASSTASRSPLKMTSPLPSPSYFHRSSPSIQLSQAQPHQHQQQMSASAVQLASPPTQRPERLPHRTGSISGLRFMSITKAPRALKRLASAGGGTFKDAQPSRSPDSYDEELENFSVGHGSMVSTSQQSHTSRYQAYPSAHHDSRWEAGASEDQRQPHKGKGFGKVFRFGSGSAAKAHQRDGSITTSEETFEQYQARLKAASSQEQLALLAQGPGHSTSTGLIRKASLTLRKRTPSLSSFAFPGNQTAPSTPAAMQFKSASSDTGHSTSSHHTISGPATSPHGDADLRGRAQGEPKRHYPPPSASTGAAAASYGLPRSATGIGSIRRKPVPNKNLSVDSSMLLQPSSFSSPSRVRSQQASPAIGNLASATTPSAEQEARIQSHDLQLRDYDPPHPDAVAAQLSPGSSKAPSPVPGGHSIETEEMGSPGSKTMSRIRKLSLRRKKGPKLSTADASIPLPNMDNSSPTAVTSPADARSPIHILSPGANSEVASPIAYLSPSKESDALSPTSPQAVQSPTASIRAAAPSANDSPTVQAGFPGLTRVTSFRKRTRETSSPEVSVPSPWQPTSPQHAAQAEAAIASASAHGPSAAAAATAAGSSGKVPGLKRSGSVGGSFLSRSNSFLSKASSSTFGSARRGRGGQNGSMASLNISGPVHLDSDGADGAMGKLGGGATVISGGPAEAFAMLAARSANPGASYVGGAFGSQPLSPASPSTTATMGSPAPFSVLSRHGPSTNSESLSANPESMTESAGSMAAPASPNGHSAGTLGGTKSLSLPRKSLSSVRSPTPSAAPASGPSDVILPSEQMKSGTVDSVRPASPQTKQSMKAELAQQLDQVLQHPEAPTRRLAHNHSRTLTPHSLSVHGGILPADLIGEVLAQGGNPANLAGGKGKVVGRASLDGVMAGTTGDDAPIVTIGPLTNSSGGTTSPGRKTSTDTESSAGRAQNAQEPALYGLGFKTGVDEEQVRDSAYEPRSGPPKDVPSSPYSQQTSPSSTADLSPGDSDPAGGTRGSRQSQGSRRDHTRTRTLSLASLLGLGLPPASSSASATTSGAANTPHFSNVGSPTVASQGHLEGQLSSRKSSGPDAAGVASPASGAGTGSSSLSPAAIARPMFAGLDADSSRPISFATSGGHEALNGHGHAPSQSSHQNRFWYGQQGRRGSIGASQALGTSSPAQVGAEADEVVTAGMHTREDDTVADLPRTQTQTQNSGLASARQSMQSQGGVSSAHGHSRRGSNTYASSEAPSLETDGDAASVMNAQLVMASRVEVRRADIGKGRNENRTGAAGDDSAQHLGVARAGEDRPISLDDRQREFLVEHTQREAARDAGKVMDGQTLRPLVVDDAPHRYSHQAVMMSYEDDVRHSGGSAQQHDDASAVQARPMPPQDGDGDDADPGPTPTTPTGAESTRSSSGSRRRTRKASYATAEAAIAARKQEQAEREMRQRAREAKRQADRQARYVHKKKTDPLLAARLALYGLQPPDTELTPDDAAAAQTHAHDDYDADVAGPAGDLSGSMDGNATGDTAQMASVDRAFAVPQLAVSSDDDVRGAFDARPLIPASELASMDDPDVPLESTGRGDAASMMVKGELESADMPHQVRVSIADPDGFLMSGDSAGDRLAPGGGGGGVEGGEQSYDSMDRPEFGMQSAASDWHSAHSHHPQHHHHHHQAHAQHLRQLQQQAQLLPVPSSLEANRLSTASSQFPDFVTTVSHQN